MVSLSILKCFMRVDYRTSIVATAGSYGDNKPVVCYVVEKKIVPRGYFR